MAQDKPEYLLLLHEVAHLIRTLIDQRARARGMTRAQWVILRWLQRTPGLSQNELAAVLEVEPITVGRLIDRLEARDLVERRDDPRDRRTNRLHLTSKAKPFLSEIAANIDELSAAALQGIEPETLDAVVTGLRAMKANLGNSDGALRKTAG